MKGSHVGSTPTVSTIQKFRINNQITYSELRVINEEGNNLGVLPLKKALTLAEELGLDLVLVVEKVVPPVARIVDFDKFRYEREKELKKQQRHKGSELKHIQISARSAKNDLLVRLKKLEEFLGAGNKVEIQLTLRGREKGKREWAEGKMKDFLEMITVPYKITREIKPGGRGFTTQIDPK